MATDIVFRLAIPFPDYAKDAPRGSELYTSALSSMRDRAMAFERQNRSRIYTKAMSLRIVPKPQWQGISEDFNGVVFEWKCTHVCSGLLDYELPHI